MNFELFIHENAYEYVIFDHFVQEINWLEYPHGTVRYRYNVVKFRFFFNAHGRAMCVFCECKPWLMFCLAHCSVVFIAVFYCTAL